MEEVKVLTYFVIIDFASPSFDVVNKEIELESQNVDSVTLYKLIIIKLMLFLSFLIFSLFFSLPGVNASPMFSLNKSYTSNKHNYYSYFLTPA